MCPRRPAGRKNRGEFEQCRFGYHHKNISLSRQCEALWPRGWGSWLRSGISLSPIAGPALELGRPGNAAKQIQEMTPAGNGGLQKIEPLGWTGLWSTSENLNGSWGWHFVSKISFALYAD